MLDLIIESDDGLRIVADHCPKADAPVVILAHGGGQTRHSWRDSSARLSAAGYEVISFDLRGHGDSEWSKAGDYSLEDMARDMIALIRRHGASRPVALVGASLGGMISLIAATTPGVKVGAVALVDVAPKIEPEGAARIRGFMLAHANGFASLDEAAEAVAAYRGKRPSGGPASLSKNLRKHDDGRWYWHWDPAFMSNKADRASTRRDVLDRAASAWRGPLLLVRGLQSDVVSDDSVQELLKIAPQTESVNVAESGHMVVSDRNDAFLDAVSKFLARHVPAKSAV